MPIEMSVVRSMKVVVVSIPSSRMVWMELARFVLKTVWFSLVVVMSSASARVENARPRRT